MVVASRVFNLSTIFGWKSEFAASNVSNGKEGVIFSTKGCGLVCTPLFLNLPMHIPITY